MVLGSTEGETMVTKIMMIIFRRYRTSEYCESEDSGFESRAGFHVKKGAKLLLGLHPPG